MKAGTKGIYLGAKKFQEQRDRLVTAGEALLRATTRILPLIQLVDSASTDDSERFANAMLDVLAIILEIKAGPA